jgi:hypothetical protein
MHLKLKAYWDIAFFFSAPDGNVLDPQREILHLTSGRGGKLTTHLHLMLRLKMRSAIPPLPLSVQGIVLN